MLKAARKRLDQDFFKTWTPEMAYVLGFFAADGNMIRNKRGGFFISFHITDRQLLFEIRKALGSDHKIGIRNRNPMHKTGYRLQIGSRSMFEDLQKLGMTPAKSHSLALPAIPSGYAGDFVRGYFDGDGCVYFKRLSFIDRKKPRWILMTIFTSGSCEFLVQLHELLKLYGVRGGSVRRKKKGFDLSLSHKDSVALYQLIYDTISDTSLVLPRKYRLFTRAIKTLYPLRP